MENCVFHHHHHHLRSMITLPQPSSLKPNLRVCPKVMRVRASAGRRHCEFSSQNAPLEPRSLVGKFLSGVLQNRRQLFHVVAKEELKMLSDDRDSALARMHLSQHSDEALLHRYVSHLFLIPLLLLLSVLFSLLFFLDPSFFLWSMD